MYRVENQSEELEDALRAQVVLRHYDSGCVYLSFALLQESGEVGHLLLGCVKGFAKRCNLHVKKGNVRNTASECFPVYFS